LPITTPANFGRKRFSGGYAKIVTLLTKTSHALSLAFATYARKDAEGQRLRLRDEDQNLRGKNFTINLLKSAPKFKHFYPYFSLKGFERQHGLKTSRHLTNKREFVY
jgi:hypothetical protein